ncbi:uncharacterized protein LOC119671532 [Teleopsis dalmanni]|uniref:uncharacterized protein LOC119671532 n=1 Tax=Teleopsis dalmanni TaxID=139649 RepID=UPI0018CFEAC8|nr:uncharacterized protein LOC119671532 [Teleopsis dalmanni]
MGDWERILMELNESDPMDFCKEFFEVKTLLEYCNDYVQCYVNISSRDCTEKLLNEIKTRMQSAFIRWGCLTKDLKSLPNAYSTLRQIVMLLILNTDITYHIDLKEQKYIAHVIDLYPPLPKFLLISIIWELKLDSLFYEIVSYSPIWYTLPLMEDVLDSLNNGKENEVMERGENMVCSMFTSLTNTQFFTRDPICATQQNIQFCKLAVKIIEKTLNVSQMDEVNQEMNDVRRRGYCIKHVLCALSRTFDTYSNANPYISDSEYKFYDIFPRQKWGKAKKTSMYITFKANVVELQLKILQTLLDTLESNMYGLDNDILLCWTQINAPKHKSLRCEIGELAFNLNENTAPLNHDVFGKLHKISMHVDSVEEKLHKSTLNDILKQLSSDESNVVKKLWFDEFLNRATLIDIIDFANEIEKHQNLMSFENCKAVLTFISEYLTKVKETEDHRDSYMKLGSTILATLNQCSNTEIIELLCYQRELFGPDVCVFQSEDFGFRSTEFFNKEFITHTFFLLCMENPSQMWKKYFDIEFYNAAQITNFCETVKISSPFCDEYFDQYLNELLMQPQRLQQKYFPTFLCEIYFKLFYHERKKDFIKEFIYKNVSTYIGLEDFKSLLSFVHALDIIGKHGDSHGVEQQNFGEITALVLIMLVQILECARWQFDSYTELRDKLVQEAIDLISATTKKFLPVANQIDRKWIAEFINKSHYLSQYYFQSFTLSESVQPLSFEDFLLLYKPSNINAENTMILYFLVRLTAKETELSLFTDHFLPYIPFSINLLANVAKNTESLNNYKNCVVTYTNFVQTILLPRYEENPSKINELLMNILKILKNAPDEVYATLFLDLQNLLIALAKKTINLPDQQQTLKQKVSNMKDCNAKNLYLKKLESDE